MGNSTEILSGSLFACFKDQRSLLGLMKDSSSKRQGRVATKTCSRMIGRPLEKKKKDPLSALRNPTPLGNWTNPRMETEVLFFALLSLFSSFPSFEFSLLLPFSVRPISNCRHRFGPHTTFNCVAVSICPPGCILLSPSCWNFWKSQER